MNENITVAVDAMGGDNAPDVVVNGTLAALNQDPQLTVVLVGPEEIVCAPNLSHDRLIPKVATEVIAMAEHPATAVRKKKDSSIVVACRMVKDGEAQGFFSAGSTGACLAAATLVIGRIKGVLRPMLATIVPAPNRPVVLCDVGANADCKAEYLVQFGIMGSLYSRLFLNVDSPSVSLLNIGEEETKGSQFAQDVHALMKYSICGFAGNAEGRDILAGTFDVVVTDGFTGNVTLKTIEGTAKTLFGSIKGVLMSSGLTKIAALAIKTPLKSLATTFSADNYGGGPLLGVKGAVVVGHGSSNEIAIKNGILQTASLARAQVAEKIAENITAALSESSAALAETSNSEEN